VGAAPEGPCNDGGGFDLALRQARSNRACRKLFLTKHGRMAWQKASGYNWRALVEADISRWKRVIGNRLRPQTDGRQASEIALAAGVLNRMLDLGRPEYVRIV
jgi:hypothetical protein